jgi:hypothetical protein
VFPAFGASLWYQALMIGVINRSAQGKRLDSGGWCVIKARRQFDHAEMAIKIPRRPPDRVQTNRGGCGREGQHQPLAQMPEAFERVNGFMTCGRTLHVPTSPKLKTVFSKPSYALNSDTFTFFGQLFNMEIL